MLAKGIEFGAHTRSHVALPDVAIEEAELEIAGSRADLERTLGRPVRTFAYPFGRVDEAIKDAVKVAGFDAAWGSRSGVSDPAAPDFALPRIEVRGTDSLLSFAVAIWRGRSPSRSARRT
ncbi:MAG: polysaccharide deacetylase family protein [Gemmatimonadales bacterium]|nr:polysaccharide deacetylase family protein [Gemmatimonadales bacterium]